MNDKLVENANRVFHDKTAKSYIISTKSADFTLNNFLKKVLTLAPKSAKLLDIGTGTGRIPRLVENTFQQAVGIDISYNMLKEGSYTQVAQASCFQLPFKNGEFNIITAYSVLHHLFSHDEFFHEVYRVLDHNGWFVSDNDSNALFHKRFGWWIKLRRAFFNKRKKTLSDEEKVLEKLSEFHHTKGLDGKLLLNALKNAGFDKVFIEYHHPIKMDLFTKILSKIETKKTEKSFRYYVRIFAKKL